MRFQSIENNKIYRLYRQDQMERLKQKIQQIKQRKNRHVHSNKQTHLLPYISPGYGFSQQRKRQIDKQNVRLQQKIKKAKDSHSTYYITKDDLSRINTINKKSKVRYIQTMTNRSVDQNMIRSLAQSDRNTLKQAEKMNKKVDIDKQEQSIRPNTFRKQIMRIYNEAFSDPKKLPL